MRKLITLILALALTLACCPADAEAGGSDIIWGTPEQAATAARAVLLAAWRTDLAEVVAKYSLATTGYLEIRSTRVFTIAEHPAAVRSDGEPISQASMFDGVTFVVEFIILTDDRGTSPYAFYDGYNDHVILLRNGDSSVGISPFRTYIARTYSLDFSGIITEVTDLGTQLNGVWHLLEK